MRSYWRPAIFSRSFCPPCPSSRPLSAKSQLALDHLIRETWRQSSDCCALLALISPVGSSPQSESKISSACLIARKFGDESSKETTPVCCAATSPVASTMVVPEFLLPEVAQRYKSTGGGPSCLPFGIGAGVWASASEMFRSVFTLAKRWNVLPRPAFCCFRRRSAPVPRISPYPSRSVSHYPAGKAQSSRAATFARHANIHAIIPQTMVMNPEAR